MAAAALASPSASCVVVGHSRADRFLDVSAVRIVASVACSGLLLFLRPAIAEIDHALIFLRMPETRGKDWPFVAKFLILRRWSLGCFLFSRVELPAPDNPIAVHSKIFSCHVLRTSSTLLRTVSTPNDSSTH